MKYIRHRANAPEDYAQYLLEQRYTGLEIDIRRFQQDERIVVSHDSPRSLSNTDRELPPSLPFCLKTVVGLQRVMQKDILAPVDNIVIVLDIKENGLASDLFEILKTYPTLRFFIMGYAGMEYPEYVSQFASLPNAQIMYRRSEHEFPNMAALALNRPYLVDSFSNDPAKLLSGEIVATRFFIGPDLRGKPKYEQELPERVLSSKSSFLITKKVPGAPE